MIRGSENPSGNWMPMCNIAAKRKVMASKTIRTPITMTMVVQRLVLISLIVTPPSPGTSSCNDLSDSPLNIYQNLVWLTKLLFPQPQPNPYVLYTQPIQLNFAYTHCTINFGESQVMKCRDTPRGQYISNKGKGHLLVRDGKASFHEHKIFKSFMRLEGFGWGEVALLGFVCVVDLFDLAPIDAQV